LTFGKGKLHVVTGLNGSGKTRLLSHLAGDKFDSTMKAQFYGQDISNNKRGLLKSMGYLPEYNTLFGVITV